MTYNDLLNLRTTAQMSLELHDNMDYSFSPPYKTYKSTNITIEEWNSVVNALSETKNDILTIKTFLPNIWTVYHTEIDAINTTLVDLDSRVDTLESLGSQRDCYITDDLTDIDGVMNTGSVIYVQDEILETQSLRSSDLNGPTIDNVQNIHNDVELSVEDNSLSIL